MNYYNEYHGKDHAAWWGGNTPSPSEHGLPEPVENKSRLGQINDLLDERLNQTKALEQACKMQGGDKLKSILNKTILNIDERLSELK